MSVRSHTPCMGLQSKLPGLTEKITEKLEIYCAQVLTGTRA